VLMGLLPPQDSTGFLDRRGAFKARERDDLHNAFRVRREGKPVRIMLYTTEL